jgi:hypothetical protein
MGALLVVLVAPAPLPQHSPNAIMVGMIVLAVLAVACLVAIMGHTVHFRPVTHHGPRRSRSRRHGNV